MFQNPLVSIIIPICNVELYLQKCIDSVINQNYKNIEIILVDDGSTDSSGMICNHNAVLDRRIKVIHKENGGLSDARNAGMRCSHGEYLFFLDSDDYLFPGTIQLLLDFVHSFAPDMVIGNFGYLYRDHEDICKCMVEKPTILTRYEAMEYLMEGNIHTFAWGKLVKTEIARSYEFPVGKLFEDHFWTHLVLNDCDSILLVPEPMVHYRQREDSISYTYNDRRLDMLDGWNERISFLKEFYPELKEQYLSRCANECTGIAWLVLMHVKCNKTKCFQRIIGFISAHQLDSYGTNRSQKLLKALKRGVIPYTILALFYHLREKKCLKEN